VISVYVVPVVTNQMSGLVSYRVNGIQERVICAVRLVN